jgi:uncharacterized protein (TIGR02118 family)
MYKVVWVARFHQGVSREQARAHWREVHAPLGAKVAGIERYVQNHVVSALGPLAPSDEPAAFDGYSCCWYRNQEAFEQSLRTPEWAALGVDSPNLFDDSRWDGSSASLDPRTIIDGPRAPFKTVWFVRFKPEVRGDRQRSAQAHERWIDSHGGHFGTRVPGIARYVQNHVVSAIDAAGENPDIAMDFDGFSECWFADRGAFELAMASPEWAAMNEDAEELFDLDYIVPAMSAVLEENVIVEGLGQRDAVPA